MNLQPTTRIRIALDASPNEADLAIVSIDELGSSGFLNKLALEAYGYSPVDRPSQQNLSPGYYWLQTGARKPILFIVTGLKANVKENLGNNLWNALMELGEGLIGRTTWISLMGLTSGRLTMDESFELIYDIISRFYTEMNPPVKFIFSIPDLRGGTAFYEKVNRELHIRDSFIEDLKNFVAHSDRSFYFAETYQYGEDRSQTFFESGTWNMGEMSEISNPLPDGVKENDILILKKWSEGHASLPLSIKGFGVVKSVSAHLQVDWRIKNISLDVITRKGYYRSIELILGNDIVTILSHLSKTEREQLLTNTAFSFSNKIVRINSDSEKGADYLGISKDIKAFARIMAARSFEPPLAIALFGKWGSGKSFFMRKLREQVEDFSQRKNTTLYCKGIVHIHFNAWSYMDANLWASFVSKIFESLHDYIRNENLGAKAVEKIKSVLSQELQVTKAGISALQEKKDAVEEQISSLEDEREAVRETVEKKVAELESHTAWKILDKLDKEFDASTKLTQALQENHSYIQTTAELQAIVPEKYWHNPSVAYEEARSAATFLKAFFHRKKIGPNLVWLVLILAAILLTPTILELLDVGIRQFNFTLPQTGLSLLATAGFAWKRAEVVYRKLQPIVASFWQVKESYESEREKALAEFAQKEKALTLEIEKGKEEVLLYTQQIQRATLLSAELDYKIRHALASETLYSFIDERSKSEDYRKHLGIISTIRKDFEILNSLFIDHNSELVDQQQAEEFRRHFNKPVERIILYIDDLDRCPEENVVQVLEAVNLLMAYPLFIVIVGVDPRWVKNALIRKYALQFTGKLPGMADTATGIKLIEPSSYLEKIFQVAFHLKEAPAESIRTMIRQLALSKTEGSAKTPASVTPVKPAASTATSSTADTIIDEKENNQSSSPASAPETASSPSPDPSAFLELSDTEISILENMGALIGPNPRALKRFVNLFKIIKAHEDYTLHQPSTREDVLAILFILAVSLGQFKDIMPNLEQHINDSSHHNRPISAYINGETASAGVTISLTALHRFRELNQLISLPDYETLSTTKISVFHRHYAFIRRFTFKNV